MPLKSFSTKADFDAAYDIGAERDGYNPDVRSEVRLGYNRAVMYPICQQRAAGLQQALAYSASTRLVVVGAGFGWTIEALRALGIGSTGKIVGTDTSAYIHNNKGLTDLTEVQTRITSVGLTTALGEGLTLVNRLATAGARSLVAADILNEATPANNAARTRIRSAVGAAGYEVLTESVLESLTDAECVSLSNGWHAATTGRIAHYVVTTRDGNQPGWNWKTLAQWKALLPNDTFVEAGYWTVL